MQIEKEISHHGTISTYFHSIHVAIICIVLVQKFSLAVDLPSLIRGALLHDYYLYYSPEDDKGSFANLFLHPRKAYNNAVEDFEINNIEKDIIIKHMFPVTPGLPKYLESWIIIYADKICALKEYKLSLEYKASSKVRV